MISVAIIVKDGEKYIEECLQSLASFDDVLLLDTGSTDRTMEIARRFQNVRIEEHAFIGFGPSKNLAAQLAKHDWILSVDSDEVVTPSCLRKSIRCPWMTIRCIGFHVILIIGANSSRGAAGIPIKFCVCIIESGRASTTTRFMKA